MPKEVVDASPEANKLSAIIGTGPYKWTEYVEDQYIRLTRFDDYVSRTDAPNYQSGAKVPYLDEIIYWIVPETATRVAGLQTGEYDVIIEVPETEFDLLDTADGIDPIKTGPGFNFYLMFNHKKGLTSNINFRKAVQAAIDAEEVMAAAIPDPEFRTLGGSFFPPESAYFNDARVELYNQANPAKAREYLALAGYKGEPVTYQVIATNPQMVRIGVAVVEQLKAAGMNAEVLNYDLQTWVSKRRDGNALMMYNSGGNWIDPSLYQPEFSGTFPSAETGFQNDEVDRVFAALNAETDLAKRIEIAAELQTLFYDLVATYNFGYHYRLVAKRDYVMDPEGNLALGNLTLNNVWLNK
jgi:peptide/nickel transport system substrate-binding protein